MSVQIAVAAVTGAVAGAMLPRVAHRLAVPFGTPSRVTCAACDRPFPPGPAGWIRVGAACPCTGPPWLAVLATASAAALLATRPALSPALLPALVVGALLAAIDLRCLRLPDRLVALLAVLVALPVALVRPAFSLLAGVLVGSAYLLVWFLPGRGLGLGDVKLAAVLGFALGQAGWPGVLLGVVLPHLINGPIAIGLLLSRRAGRRTALPFGPALLAGALVALVITTPA